MISAAKTRAALALLGWTSLTLAKRAMLTFDDVAMALDDVEVRCLGGLQLGAVREELEAAEVEFLHHGEPGMRLRKERPGNGV